MEGDPVPGARFTDVLSSYGRPDFLGFFLRRCAAVQDDLTWRHFLFFRADSGIAGSDNPGVRVRSSVETRLFDPLLATDRMDSFVKRAMLPQVVEDSHDLHVCDPFYCLTIIIQTRPRSAPAPHPPTSKTESATSTATTCT